MDNILYEIFDELPRQGPGDDEYTRKAFHIIPALAPNPKIIDLGCGTGMQTLELARISFGKVTGIDNYEPYIGKLRKKIADEGLDNCKAEVGDMFTLDLEKGSCDLIWSEGSIYIMGLENGLTEWKNFLKDDGYMVFSDIAWFEDHRPNELLEFWAREVPDMMYTDEQKKIIENCGYDLIDNFQLPSDVWWDNFYSPLEKKLLFLREKYWNNNEVLNHIEMTQKEIEIFKKYSDYYGYVFYIMKNGNLL